jgi:hypothetical protein
LGEGVLVESESAETKSEETTGYSKPRIVDYGTLAQLTAANTDARFLDRTMPTQTPQASLTFSD